jgi:hypothetical protein
MTESDDALMLRVAREEIKRQSDEIERLKTRLEVSPDHDYDGIASRDETIRMQDDRIAALREQEPVNARLLDSAKAALEALTCSGEQDDPGHRCGHCDDYVDRNGVVRASLRVAIAAAEAQQAEPSSLPDKTIADLEADAARYRYIRTHRIGVKWCELYAGGPALDDAIDATMRESAPEPVNHAGLRESADKAGLPRSTVT